MPLTFIQGHDTLVSRSNDLTGASPRRLSRLALPVDCLGDFGTRGLSDQYTQNVRGCPPAHTGRPWLSVSTHRTSVAVRQHKQDHPGPWTQHTGPSHGLFGTHRTSVAVHQYKYTLVLGLSTLVLGLSTLTLPVDCSGDFGPRGLTVQYTQDVRGCPLAHTRRPCVSVSTHRTSVTVRVCPCVSVSTHRCLWLSISTHISTLILELSTLTLPVDCLGDFGPRVLSVQYTQDICGCPPAHTRRPWLYVCVRQCASAHTGRPWLSISTHIRTLVLGLSMLALPVDCLGDFGPRGLSVQYTQDHTEDVRGCPSAHTRLPFVFGSKHWTYVAVRLCLSAHTGRLWLSISTHISTLVLGHSMLALPMDCLGDFGTRGMSVQYTQDVRGCPWLSVSTHRMSVAVPCWPFPWTVWVILAHVGCLFSTHRTSVGVRQHTQDICGCPCVSVCVRQHTQDIRGCPSAHTRRPCVSGSKHGTSVAIRLCLSAHTGRPWLSISTHISTLVFGLSRLALPVDCLGDFGTRGLSVQYTQNIRGCPPAHTGRLWLSVAVHQHTQDVRGCPSAHTGLHTGRPCLSVSTHITSVAVRVCPFVSVSTHRTSVAVHQYTYQHGGPRTQHAGPWTQHAGPWTQHAGPSRGLFGHPWLSVAVHGCSSAHTERPWLSVCVRVCPSAHLGRLWLFISTHISMLVFGLSTLALPLDCSGDFGPCGLSVQDTQDVCGCPSAQTGRPWVSVSTHMTSVAVRVCPCVSSAHTGRLWLSISTHISTLVLGLSTLTLPVDCSGDFGPRGLTRQYTQFIRGCPLAHTGRPCVSVSTHRTSMAVRLCPCVSVSTHMTSVAVHQYIYLHVGRWTQHADPSRGLFG
ncbi:hypothetical protein IGI04_042332 [Brassica rapa subsp. trilocularis]|uniref:Uncharacterized protein n=1 Tax=Brassica rapa subsp. trilocularis TaxID=1813537 RepID=A0ABQ7KK88_BRACM|nr:hypothetical protein IGI04_042332 [Brassica rapa subsp. trilocularis]